MEITSVIYMVILLAVGFGMGWLYAQAHTMDDYNHMYSHLTCEIISRMQQAMRSMRMDQDDIDRVIHRMGCKIMPPSVPPPPSPHEKLKVEHNAWSEDVQDAISLLKHIAEEQEKDYCPHNANALRKAAQYLETCRPQSTWKPSDNELEVLRLAAEKDGACLMGLYEQLKKLREK